MEVQSSLALLSVRLTFISRPGEDLAASGFVAITFYLFVDINLGVYRLFRKKSGLYFWCMLLGTLGCTINAVAVVLKSFLPDSEPIWPLYTLFMLLGWTIYAPAQLLILYSRLHLVNQNRMLQRWVLVMIIVVASLMIIPSWVLAWLAYNPYDKHLSSIYSPREAILDRCTQLGYTIAETIVSGTYIYSLFKLLNLKSSVRQRRVMTDLVYINIIAICLDILTVVLVFLNQTGISHPIQAFTYILKLKLEFVVLNQLMAVAARGIKKENHAERRYYHHPPSASDEKEHGPSGPIGKTPRWGFEWLHQQRTKTGSADGLVVPVSTLSKATGKTDTSQSQPTPNGRKWPTKAKFKKHGSRQECSGVDEDEDEEIEVHMWENRGRLVMEIPWFKKDGQP